MIEKKQPHSGNLKYIKHIAEYHTVSAGTKL